MSKDTSLVKRFASRFNIDPVKFLEVLKKTAFRQKQGVEISNEQMAALLVVADQYNLNPFTKEIYAFPDKTGAVIPVVGLDGWSRITNEHKAYDGVEFRYSDNTVPLEGARSCPEWIECIIHRNDRAQPTIVREYLDECYKPPYVKNGRAYPGAWQTHTKRMLRTKAFIQCARIAFGFAGIYDLDEAQNIAEAHVVNQHESLEPEALSHTEAELVVIPADLEQMPEVAKLLSQAAVRAEAEGSWAALGQWVEGKFADKPEILAAAKIYLHEAEMCQAELAEMPESANVPASS